MSQISNDFWYTRHFPFDKLQYALEQMGIRANGNMVPKQKTSKVRWKWEFEQMGILATFSLDRQNGNVAWCRLLESCFIVELHVGWKLFSTESHLKNWCEELCGWLHVQFSGTCFSQTTWDSKTVFAVCQETCKCAAAGCVHEWFKNRGGWLQFSTDM